MMKKIPIWKNVILLIAIVVGIMIATFAWFYKGPKAEVGDITVQVGKATYVQISGGSGDKWTEDLDKFIGVNKNFREISGDGSNFFKPVYEVVGSDADEEDSQGYYTELVSFEKVSEAEKSKYYYEEVIEFRSDVEQEIYLDPLSYVIAGDPESEDFIHGAVRIAFFELKDGKETLKCIWAPNSTVEYSEQDYSNDGTVEASYRYLKRSDTVAEFATDEQECGYDASHRFMWSNSRIEPKDGQNLPENAPSLLTLDARKETDEEHFYKTMKVKVWLEGYDRECVSLLNGQRFTIRLRFRAQEGE